MPRQLLEIPYVDATKAGALDTARAENGRFQAIVTTGREHYGKLASSPGIRYRKTGYLGKTAD